MIYDVTQQKLRASLEHSWAAIITRYVQQLMHRSDEYILAAFHVVLNKVEQFKHLQSLGLRNAMCTCVTIYSYSPPTPPPPIPMY